MIATTRYKSPLTGTLRASQGHDWCTGSNRSDHRCGHTPPQSSGVNYHGSNSTIEAYLRAFVNWEQDDWARLLPMAEFAYNNAKNASTGHTPFELNYSYHLRVSFEEDVDPRSRSRSANKLAEKLRELIEVCCQNLLHAQELQKKAHDKGVKSRSYTPGQKVWGWTTNTSKRRGAKSLRSQINAFFVPVVAVQEEWTPALIPNWWSHGSGEQRANRTRFGLMLRTSTSASSQGNYGCSGLIVVAVVAMPWEEGLSFRQSSKHVDGSCWMIVCECMINQGD